MSVGMFVMYNICVFFFFLLLIEIISIAKLLIIVHFFIWKHEKQTLSYIHTKFEGDRNTCFFFLQFILWEHPFFCPNTQNYLGLRGWCPWNYLVWIGLNKSQTIPPHTLPPSQILQNPSLRKTRTFNFKKPQPQEQSRNYTYTNNQETILQAINSCLSAYESEPEEMEAMLTWPVSF